MSKTVLIIEDNPQNYYLMEFLLKKKGFKVIGSDNGREGITKAKSFNPDLILLDIQLPLLDGYEVASELKSSKMTQDIPIVAVTSYAMVGDKEKVLAAGANGYIEKPIDPDTFLDDIAKFIN